MYTCCDYDINVNGLTSYSDVTSHTRDFRVPFLRGKFTPQQRESARVEPSISPILATATLVGIGREWRGELRTQ